MQSIFVLPKQWTYKNVFIKTVPHGLGYVKANLFLKLVEIIAIDW